MTPSKLCALVTPLLCAMILTTAGCGGLPKPIKVKGIVTLDGKPVPGATVTFTPVDEGRVASGRTDDDGSFRLTTFATDDGALPGTYKVVVMVQDADDKLVGRSPGTFTEEEKRESRMTMTPKGKKMAALKKPRSTLPKIYSDVKQTPLQQVVPPSGDIELALRSGSR